VGISVLTNDLEGPMADFQQITVAEEGTVTIVRFVDSKIRDEDQIQVLGDELFSLVDNDNTKSLLLNFEDVEIMSSAALGKLIRLDKKVKKSEGKLKLCSICANIYEVFSITKLDQMYDIHPDQASALGAF
jgi:anti-sigma B factor antagonist